MSELTLKSRKQEILDAYLSAKEENERLKRLAANPVTEAAAKVQANVMAVAETAVKEEIFNPAIVEKYNCVTSAIQTKEAELQELYGIEAKAGELASFITSCAQKEAELEADFKQKKETMEAEFKAHMDAYQAELNELADKKVAMLAEVRKEFEQEKKALEILRKREAEEYAYDLKRSKKKENDAWEDEKMEREKLLAEKEAKANEMLAELQENKDAWEVCQQRVNEIPNLIAKAKEEGMKEGKEKAEKANVFEVRYLKKDYESQIAVLTAEKESLTRVKADLEKENTKLSTKLDEAYARINDLAVKTAEATRTKYVTSEQTSK